MLKSISSKTKIKQLLEVNQSLVIDTLVKLNKNFVKLRNPVLRSLITGRVTIADACRLSGSTIQDFMARMEQIGFIIDDEQLTVEPEAPAISLMSKPVNHLELDVRPILAQNKDPLKEILAAVKKLKEGEALKLINSFEPSPLINLLTGRGFSHRIEAIDDNTVVTYFTKSVPPGEAISIGQPNTGKADDEQFDRLLATFSAGRLNCLDVRQLEMPKPMLAILEQTQQLSNGDALFVHHKKVPVYLLPELEKKGLKYLFKNVSAGNVDMLIYKP